MDTKNVVVVNHTKAPHIWPPARYGNQAFGQQTLLPGRNEVPQEYMQALKASDAWGHIESEAMAGRLTIVEDMEKATPAEKKTAEEPLSSTDIREAKAMVQKETNATVLREWLGQGPPKELVRAIEKRLAELEG